MDGSKLDLLPKLLTSFKVCLQVNSWEKDTSRGQPQARSAPTAVRDNAKGEFIQASAGLHARMLYRTARPRLQSRSLAPVTCSTLSPLRFQQVVAMHFPSVLHMHSHITKHTVHQNSFWSSSSCLQPRQIMRLG